MKVIVLVLLATLAVYCTAKPLKEKEANSGADVWKNGFPRLNLNLKGKRVDVGADISEKAFPGMKGVRMLKTLDGKLMKGGSSGKDNSNEALALQFGQMGKQIQKTLDSMHKVFEQYQKNKGEK
ncbi:hypothetical protein HOLleu_17057 [Holothuria leucospilota]|uniref:Uncharacterized protein n=1 Tax=Holothuria leucospilota TaxID=206669 RepID=A0A9Q1C7C2_HOLLE|nr:hypothetical protein HOLleu_17057 [Holothuria leucospilota]